MSEKKKPWSVRAVYGRTLDEVAANLEDTLNRFEGEGIGVSRIDEVGSKDGYGYVVIAHAQEEEAEPQVTVIPLNGLHTDLTSKSITKKFLNALVEGVPTGDWDTVEKNAVKVLPGVVASYTSAEIVTIADDLDLRRKQHLEQHPDQECSLYKALSTISKLLRDRIGLHIS